MRLLPTTIIVLAMAAPAPGQGPDRNDTNDPPPLPRPTPAQMVGLRRLERLARYLEHTPGGTVERFVRRELALCPTARVDLPAMARHFALTEDEARRLLGGADPARSVRRHLHWWRRYVAIEGPPWKRSTHRGPARLPGRR